MTLAAANFFSVVMRESTQRDLLTKQEQEYLANWRTPEAIEVAARGIYCMHLGRTGLIMKALKGGTTFGV